MVINQQQKRPCHRYTETTEVSRSREFAAETLAAIQPRKKKQKEAKKRKRENDQIRQEYHCGVDIVPYYTVNTCVFLGPDKGSQTGSEAETEVLLKIGTPNHCFSRGGSVEGINRAAMARALGQKLFRCAGNTDSPKTGVSEPKTGWESSTVSFCTRGNSTRASSGDDSWP